MMAAAARCGVAPATAVTAEPFRSSVPTAWASPRGGLAVRTVIVSGRAAIGIIHTVSWVRQHSFSTPTYRAAGGEQLWGVGSKEQTGIQMAAT